METSVNNKCRAFTSLEQSRKLAEILPLESADMMYQEYETVIGDDYGYNYRIQPFFSSNIDGIPCWSLAALFNVLPVIIGDVLSENALRLRMDKSETDFNVWYENFDSRMAEEGLDIIKSNSVDACYEMIIRLHGLKML